MSVQAPALLDPGQIHFPPIEQALEEPNGLLAIGGDLSPERLLHAYRHGIFPWYEAGQPILWWSPDPRAVIFPEHYRPSTSLRKRIRRGDYQVTTDQAFSAVVAHCAAPRTGAAGTWITREMHAAYCRLHRLGFAHSVESWQQGELVGGLYGVAIDRVFFGESMFSRRSDASKVAFAQLVDWLREWGYRLIDCQVANDHMISLGAEQIDRARFARLLHEYCQRWQSCRPWVRDAGAVADQPPANQ